MKYYQKSNRGLIHIIIIIVVAILILSYFGFSLRDTATSDTTKDNFSYIGEVLSTLWQKVLKAPVLFMWNIFKEYMLGALIDKLKDGNTATTTVTKIIELVGKS